MIITCPSCKSRFLVENQNLKAKRLHCNKCGNLWAVGEDQAGEARVGGKIPWRHVLLLGLLGLAALVTWAIVHSDQTTHFLFRVWDGFARFMGEAVAYLRSHL